MTPVRHLLLDADGVLQHVGGDGWRAEIERRLGDRTADFVRAVDDLEAPALVGQTNFPDGLAEVLEVRSSPRCRGAVRGALGDDRPGRGHARSCGRDRSSRLTLHLATNQHARRAELMQRTLGYEDVMDGGFYSCELGVAKPDPAFFGRVLEHLGNPDPATVALVDDSLRNVESAARVGLRAVHWHLDEGLDLLRSRLAEHGISADVPGTP